jgi:hypothetical protein
MATESVIDKLTQQILSQGTSDKWTGTGKGSAQANAAEMARIIADTGVTDISQFGTITKPANVDVIPIFQPVLQGQGDSQEYVNQVVGYQDANGNIVDPSKVSVLTDYGGESGNMTTSYIAPVGIQTTYGNKATGQEVANTYGERQTGNAFGGTFEGSGNTGYRVDTSSGTPVFYTTKASSNDLFNLLADNPLLNVGANVLAGIYGGPAGVAALNAAQGKDFKDVATATLLAYAGQQAGNYLGGGTPPVVGVDGAIPITGADLGIDYSLANGVGPTNLTSMGGAQGLQGGTSANLTSMGGGQGITLNLGAPSVTLADVLSTFGGVNPANLTNMGGAQGLTYQTPTGLVTSTTTLPIGGLTGNNNVIGETGINTATNIGSSIGSTIPTTVINPPVLPPVVTTPVVTPPAPPPVVPPVGTPTITDVLRTIAPIASIVAATTALTPTTTTPTGFGIVPIPADWKTPPKPTVAPFTPLTPINFGTQNLLRGTQFEEFLNPNYGKVPEPVKYSQPSNLSYNDLMSILGSKQGSASSLSINDIISGIQNQYGQTPTRTMG